MYYENFTQYVRHKTESYNIADIKDEGDFCRVIPNESMSVNEFRYLFAELENIEDISVFMDNPEYLIVEHDI